MSLSDRLSILFSNPVQIRVHENRSCYLKVEKRGSAIKIHLHRLFEEAPSPVLEAIVSYSRRKDRKALALIRQMAQLYFTKNKGEAAPLVEKGAVYDLRALYEEIKAAYFDPSYDAAIGWSAAKPRGSFRFITFGSYDRQLHQIRINPLLDASDVPLYFIHFIVYHEMLHAVCHPIIDAAGRARVHTAEFKQREKLHPDYIRSKEWANQSLAIFKKRKKGHGRA